ncbi:MAG TPA: hypothetical protein VG826_23780 [Pirellulales bacterium]|nr:hypothetical protein [Pirellulales bacterium]
MKRCLTLIALGLVVCAGCGEIGGNRRQASGSVGGAGLVGSDVNSLASGPPAQPSAPPAVSPPTMMPASQPAQQPAGQAPAPQPGAAAGAVQPPAPEAGGGLPGLPGVNLPGQPPAQPQPGVVTEKAQVGATGKGNYGGGPGMVTTPISVYFQAQERVIFLTVEHTMNLYEAEHGHKPKTEEEFMKQIIEANQIRLPQLPPGSKYKYDPQKGELLVERPQ